MKLTFLGATHEVTGSCTLIEVNGKYGLVDCGMEQGEDVFVNREIPVDPNALDFVLLTHAHVDHSGNIPMLFNQGYDGPVYATEATCNLCEIMLADCAHIQEQEAEWQNRKRQRMGLADIQPVYSMLDAENAIKHLRRVKYGEKIQVGEGIDIRFVDAGHLMGSASIEIWLTEDGVTKKVVFSGDIGNFNQPIIKNNPTYIEEADYVITESTYGDRLHEQEEVNKIDYLAEIIQKTLDRGGNVVIPSFAVGRTQEILYFIRQIKEAGMVTGHDDFPVYVDSPLANEATAIFLQCGIEYFDEETTAFIERGINPLMSDGVKLSVSTEESKNINFNNEPKVIISASGMCDAGRIRHHLKHNLWRKECTVLFVGYQSIGTLGRKLADGAKTAKLFNEEIEVNAEIAQFRGMSGHADRDGLLQWIRSFKTDPFVFVNHGDDDSCVFYANMLADDYGFKTSAPYSGSVYDLIKGEYEVEAKGEYIKKEQRGSDTKLGKTKSRIFDDLVAAAEKLLRAAKTLKGVANRDLEELTKRINTLIEDMNSYRSGGK